MSNLPFVEEILADLRRFKECVEDGQDVDLTRDRFDLLTKLGLLERGAALWVMTQAGEDAIAQTAGGEPAAWECVHRGYVSLSYEKEGDPERAVPLFRAAPPAASHGDEATRAKLCEAYESGYQDGQKWPDSYSIQADKDKVADALIAAMRAQAGEGGE